MKLTYTILEGNIECDGDFCQIPFALVFRDNGVFKAETFLKDKDFFKRHKEKNRFIIRGKTEKGYDIEMTDLSFTLYESSNQKFSLSSRGHIKLENNKENVPVPNSNSDYKIWFVEIEGFGIRFADYTEVHKYRDKNKVNEFEEVQFDHTNCSTIINGISEGNYFHLRFFKNPANNNILIDFRWREGYCEMRFDEYLKIKNDLVSFLSFINDKKVFVRRELTGKYYSQGGSGFDAQTVFIFSKLESNNEFFNSYIPVTDFPVVISDLFFTCFDNYVSLNKDLDFNSLVFSINNSTEVNGLLERYFILITAFERIASLYSKTMTSKTFLMNSDEFNLKIRPKLFSAIEFLKEQDLNAWSIMNSKLGNINARSQNDTVQRLFEFLNFAKIPINKNIIDLVEIERHQAVHEGIIGSSENEMVKNYLKLDHVLRDTILNLIEYRNHRYRKYNYASKDEFEKAYPKIEKVPRLVIR